MSDRFVDLLRHGEVVGGGRFRGDTDDPLSASGWEQMRATTAGRSDWDALIASPARRCAEFSHELAGERDLPLQLWPALGERRFGAWENRRAADIPLEDLNRFWTDPQGFTPPAGEPFLAFRDRVLAAWDRLLGQTFQHPLVVTHGGVIRIVLGAILGMPPEALLLIEVPPACLTRLRIPTGGGQPSLLFHAGPAACGAPY
ncbi:MAG: histidine phosphatase family protein [Pseudomonadota bacterium]|nr:histidine phosphatase family protein [Pseudomonadota bacterium]